jgi:hypothetical protein
VMSRLWSWSLIESDYPRTSHTISRTKTNTINYLEWMQWANLWIILTTWDIHVKTRSWLGQVMRSDDEWNTKVRILDFHIVWSGRKIRTGQKIPY